MRLLSWLADIAGTNYSAFLLATVDYFGEDVPVEWAKDPETLLQMGGRPKGCSEVQARAHAETVCAKYKDWLELRAECDEESFEL